MSSQISASAIAPKKFNVFQFIESRSNRFYSSLIEPSIKKYSVGALITPHVDKSFHASKKIFEHIVSSVISITSLGPLALLGALFL